MQIFKVASQCKVCLIVSVSWKKWEYNVKCEVAGDYCTVVGRKSLQISQEDTHIVKCGMFVRGSHANDI